MLLSILRHFFTLLAAAGLLAPGAASAEQWYFIGASSSGDRFYVDIENLLREGDMVRAWVRLDLNEPKSAGAFKGQVAQYLDRNLMDCKKKRNAVVARVARSANGSVIENNTWPEATVTFREVIPGGMGEMLSEFACARGTALAGGNAKSLLPDAVVRSQWVQTGVNDEGVRYSVAGDRVTLGTKDFSGLIFYFQRADNVSPKPLGLDRVSSTIALWIGNCATRSILHLGSLSLGEGSKVLFRSEPADPKPITVKAGTIGSGSLDFACKEAAKDGGSGVDTTKAPGSTATAEKKPRETIGSGTAWYSESGYFVTAQHVIAGAHAVFLAGSDKEPIPAKVVAADEKNDVAILSANVTSKTLRPVRLSKGAVSLGARVFTIGYPHFDVLGISPKVTSGEVSGFLPLEPTKILISVPVQSGNSGGPLFDMNGEVVGLVIEKLRADKMLATKGDLTENTNFALKAKYIEALLEDLPRRPTMGAPARQKNQTLDELVAQFKDSVYFVITKSSAASK